MVGQQVMVEGGSAPSPDAAITVGPLAVYGIFQAFGDEAPLQGKILILVKGDALIGRPAHGTVVDDDLADLPASEGIAFLLRGIPHAEAENPDDDIVGVDSDRIVAQGNPVARCRLSGNGQVTVFDAQLRFQRYGA